MSKSNVEEIDAFVRDEVLPDVESQIVVNNALLARLEGMGKYVADSGENIRTGARYAHLPGGMYSRGAKFSTTQKETVKEFIHDWKMAYVDVTIDGWTEAVTMGSNKIRNYVQDKMNNAQETISQILNDTLRTGGEGDNVDGIKRVCDDGTNYSTYGTLSRSTDTWAKGQLDATGGAYSNTIFQTMYGQCSKNNKKPDMIITTQAVYNSMWGKMTPQQRYQQSTAHADLRAIGFTGIEFNEAIVIVEDDMETGLAFFLNTDFLEFVVHKDRNMAWQDFMPHLDEDAKTGRFYWMGNLICTAPRYEGQVQSLT
jgi:hypothetical protein